MVLCFFVIQLVSRKLNDVHFPFQLDPSALDTYKPWVVESALVSLKSMRASYEGSTAVDLYFIQKAIESKMPVIELESYESQLGECSMVSQKKTLKATLHNFDVLDDGVDQIAEMWITGNDQ